MVQRLCRGEFSSSFRERESSAASSLKFRRKLEFHTVAVRGKLLKSVVRTVSRALNVG